MISNNGIIEDFKFIGWRGVEATDWEAPAGPFFALFCSDGERAENSTKQAELLGGYTAYRDAIVPSATILGAQFRTVYTCDGHI